MCCFEFSILLQQMNAKPPIRGHHPRPPLPSYEQAVKRRPNLQHRCPAAHPRASISDLVTCARRCVYPEHRVDTLFLDNYDQPVVNVTPPEKPVTGNLQSRLKNVQRTSSLTGKNPSIAPQRPLPTLQKNSYSLSSEDGRYLSREKPPVGGSSNKYIKENVPVRRVRWSHANVNTYASLDPICIQPEQPPPKPPRKFPPASRSFGSSQSLIYFKSDDGYHSKSSSSDSSSLSGMSMSNSTTPVKNLLVPSSLFSLAQSSESVNVLPKQSSSSFVRSTWKGNTLVL